MKKFLSICSGIEAASRAFNPLGWEAIAFAEIEPFPCQLLTQFRHWPHALLAQADILCGGTPCQAFSVAGLRGSLDDARGNLTLTYCHLYDHLDHIRRQHGRPPAICIWENVPGIFSDQQNAFGCFLAGLVGETVPLQPAGGKWTHAGAVSGPQRAAAWRVLDAQYHGLAQRRQRVIVVASADPTFDPAAVLLEFDGLRRDSPPCRHPGQNTAPTLSARAKGGGGLGTDAECDGAVIAEICPIPCSATQQDAEQGMLIPFNVQSSHPPAIAFPEHLSSTQCVRTEDLSPVLQSHNPTAVAFQPGNISRGAGAEPSESIFPTLKADGGRAFSDQSPHVAYTVHGTREGTRKVASATDLADTIRSGTGSAVQNSSNTLALSFHENQRAELTLNETAGALKNGGGKPGQGYPAVLQNWAVRRLTPEECELLQGFPIGYTLLPKGKRQAADLQQTITYLITLGFSPAEADRLAPCPDGPRYKALGNSWAVPVFTWVAHRIHHHLLLSSFPSHVRSSGFQVLHSSQSDGGSPSASDHPASSI